MTIRSEDSVLDHYQAMELAVSALMIDKGYFTEADMAAEIDAMAKRTPDIGAAVVAQAWTDPDFKARLLADGTAACESIGLDMGPTRLMVVESTDTVHNVIVCTLCSCFPRMLMGIPPDWYKSKEYRSRVVREPRVVLKEFGTQPGANVSVRVHDNSADMRYLVLPKRPEGTDGMSREELAKLVTRDSMIGVKIIEAP
ncbi:MAG: nitrile hydratase subunit alpha [Alphaproteobacteria bacterium]